MMAAVSRPARPSRAKTEADARRRALWGRVKKLARGGGMSSEEAEDVMRDHVFQLTNGATRSTKGLSRNQHAELISRLDELLAERPRTRAARAAVEDGQALVTPEQGEALLELGLAVGLSRERLRNWITGHMKEVCRGMPWPQTREQASKVIEGLKAWLVRQPRSQPPKVAQRAARCLEYSDLTGWERNFLATLVERKGFPSADRRRKGMFPFQGHWKPLTKLAEIERKHGDAVDLPGSS